MTLTAAAKHDPTFGFQILLDFKLTKDEGREGGVWRSVQQLDRVVSPGGNVPSLTLPIFYQEAVSPAPYSTRR